MKPFTYGVQLYAGVGLGIGHYQGTADLTNMWYNLEGLIPYDTVQAEAWSSDDCS